MRYFTDAELAEEARPLSDRAIEALDAGNMERLHWLLNQMAIGHRELHMLALHWLTRMFSRIRTDFGEPFLEDLLARTAGYLVEPYARAFRSGQDRQTIAELVGMFTTMPGADVCPMGERDDVVSFVLAPCGGGGRLQLEGWQQAMPEHYAPCADGTPIFCRGCQALQQAFNTQCGFAAWTTRLRPELTGTCEMRFGRQGGGAALFEASELYRLGKPRVQQALEELASGNPSIHHLLREQQHEWMPLHDLYVQWATYLMSAVYTARGADYLLHFLEHTYNSVFEAFYLLGEALDDVSLLRMFARVWHYHIAKFRVEEEDDRFVFILDPCGSGGRMLRAEMTKGGFRYGDGRALEMEQPHDINFRRSDFPIYCTHCASTNRAQFAGRPWLFVVDGHAQRTAGHPCVQYLYKKSAPRRIDPAVLAQVGAAADQAGPASRS